MKVSSKESTPSSPNYPNPTTATGSDPVTQAPPPATQNAPVEASADMPSTKKLLEDFASVAKVGFEFMGEEQKKGAGPALWLAYQDERFRGILKNQVEKCVREGQKKGEKQGDVVRRCFNAKAMLKKCMEANPEYCGPLLKAEKDTLEEVLAKSGTGRWKFWRKQK